MYTFADSILYQYSVTSIRKKILRDEAYFEEIEITIAGEPVKTPGRLVARELFLLPIALPITLKIREYSIVQVLFLKNKELSSKLTYHEACHFQPK